MQPAPPCRVAVDPSIADPQAVDPLSASQPLGGVDPSRLTAGELDLLAAREGICHEFRLMRDFADRPGGYSRKTCLAPGEGEIVSMVYDSRGVLIVIVHATATATGSPMPDGAGCPTLAPAS